MDQETLGHIFEPFFTTKGPGKGTGLGLSTVFGIVEKMAGWIDVTSVLGQGTIFRIYMPVAPGSTAADDTQRLALPPVAKPAQTILLVEDEAPVRTVIATMLRRQGYQVLEAGTAAQAVRQVAKHNGRIDLLITDIVMPNINGAELSRWLTEMRPDMRILYISGYTDDHIARHDLRGATLLEKPFTREALAMKVRTVLEAA
jgi:two-component system cell cycle sensor histidine kinase/response regulator CckA